MQSEFFLLVSEPELFEGLVLAWLGWGVEDIFEDIGLVDAHEFAVDEGQVLVLDMECFF